jgi:hypothetical protein
MVFLGPAGGQIEVRLVKPPFDATERIYFDEYEELGKPHPEKLSYESFRYIASENTTYAIEVTLKKGFKYETYAGILVWVWDKARKVQIGREKFAKTSEENVLENDVTILVTTLSGAIVDGKEKDKVNLSFSGLSTGKFRMTSRVLI